jgi:hypothetical protein
MLIFPAGVVTVSCGAWLPWLCDAVGIFVNVADRLWPFPKACARLGGNFGISTIRVVGRAVCEAADLRSLELVVAVVGEVVLVCGGVDIGIDVVICTAFPLKRYQMPKEFNLDA